MKNLEQYKTIPALPARAVDAHKGNFGRALIVGGSQGMIGAPALAANAALRSGAGLVTVAVPAAIQQTVAGLCPCATSLALAEQSADLLAPGHDVLAVGCGMGRGRYQQRLIEEVLRLDGTPVVLDADGLNNLAALGDWPAQRSAESGALILTPHPGEIRRLQAGLDLDGDADRTDQAVALARRTGAIVVLKGAGTVATDGQQVYVNQTGNPGLASGGTGDVLTGVIAALLGQGLDALQAAALGVHVHGLAGDRAAEQLGQVSLIATDVIDHLPGAFTQLQAGPQ